MALPPSDTWVPRSSENSHPLGAPYGPRHSPAAGFWGWAFSYERSIPATNTPCPIECCARGEYKTQHSRARRDPSSFGSLKHVLRISFGRRLRGACAAGYSGAPLTRKCMSLGLYSTPMPRAKWWSRNTTYQPRNQHILVVILNVEVLGCGPMVFALWLSRQWFSLPPDFLIPSDPLRAPVRWCLSYTLIASFSHLNWRWISTE